MATPPNAVVPAENNCFQLLNSAIDESDDGGQFFKRWQQRMLSYRPRQHKNTSRNGPSSSKNRNDAYHGCHGCNNGVAPSQQHYLQPRGANHTSATRTDTAPTGNMRYGSNYNANANPNTRRPETSNAPKKKR